MLQGTVRRFNKDKGYGFITPDNAPKEDLFVHYTCLLYTSDAADD